MKEIRRLNTLRGLSALIVVISHYSNSTDLFNTLLGRGAGQIGVMLFFMLSGFLITYLYIQNKFNSSEVRKYLISRFARVVPLFLLIIVASYALRAMDIKGVLYNIPDFKSLLSHLFLLYGKSVLWTIPTELFFYLLFILIWWIWSKNNSLATLLIICCGVIFLMLDFTPNKGKILGLTYQFRLFQSLPFFFMGMIFGIMKAKNLSFTPPSYFPAVLMMFLIPLLFPNIFSIIFGFKHQMWNSGLVLGTLSLVFFTLVFLIKDNFRLLENQIGDFLGRISYSVYLLHLPVLYHFKPAGREQPELFIIPFLAVTILVSYLSYRFIEDPCRKIIKDRC